MARKYNTKHPMRGRSNYKRRVKENGGADRYGKYENGDQKTPDRLLRERPCS